MPRIDLHTHTSHSHDGDVEPSELVGLARERGIEHLAVADHNRVTALPEAVETGTRLGVEIIPGIEIDCGHKNASIHLLGLYIDYADGAYTELWADALRRKREAGMKRADRVRALGLFFEDRALEELAQDGMITGTMVADAALRDPRNADSELLRPYRPGGPKSVQPQVGFWWDWCAKGKPAHVDESSPSFRDMAALIRDTGGVPVIAHPECNLAAHPEYIPELRREGAAGIEVYCSYHNPDRAAYWLKAARDNDMLITCGSDYHGSLKPDIQLGGHGADALAGEILSRLREAAERHRRRPL